MTDTRTATQATNDRYNRIALHQFIQAGRAGESAAVLADLRRRIMPLDREAGR